MNSSEPSFQLSPELTRKVRWLWLTSRKKANGSLLGEFRSAFRGSGMEFEEFREYVPGDEVRQIDWNVTARLDRPFVRTYREERDRHVMIALDTSASMFDSFKVGKEISPKKEQLLTIATLLSLAAGLSGDRVGMALLNSELEKVLPPKKGREESQKMLRTLLQFKPSSLTTDLNQSLLSLVPRLKKGTLLFIISDFLSPVTGEVLKRLKLRADPLLIRVSSTLETSLPAGLLCEVKDVETGQKQYVDFASAFVRGQFHQQVLAKRHRDEKLWNSLGIDWCDALSGVDPLDSLIALFKKRERRRR